MNEQYIERLREMERERETETERDREREKLKESLSQYFSLHVLVSQCQYAKVTGLRRVFSLAQVSLIIKIL